MVSIRGALTLVLACSLAACVAPSGDRARQGSPRSGKITVSQKLSQLEGDPTALITWVDAQRDKVRDRAVRAEMDLARAQALAALGRDYSARSAMSRAWTQVAPRVDGIGARIQVAWASLEFRGGDRRAARDRLAELVGARGLEREARLDATARLVVMSEALGDSAGASRWRDSLGGRGDSLIRLARNELQPAVPLPDPVFARGGIPTDPREILADIRPRQDWGPAAIRDNKDLMTTIRAVTVHHSAMPRNGSPTGQIRTIQALHQGDKGWADIGYHFLVDAQGGIWEGRPLRWQGAHAGDAASNRGNIGVCLLGDFQTQWVTADQQASLERLLDALRGRFGLQGNDVWPHQHFRATACPGTHLLPIVKSYRARSVPLG